MDITVDGPQPGAFRWSLVVSEHRDDLPLADALEQALREIDDEGRVQLWIREVDAEADAIATSFGFQRYRDLWQLRCLLPNRASGPETRAFTPDDLDDFVRVNNRAWAQSRASHRAKAKATKLAPMLPIHDNAIAAGAGQTSAAGIMNAMPGTPSG